jgi:hypothetical protein
MQTIPELSISKFFVDIFEVSETDFAATLSGGHIRNVTSLSLPGSQCHAGFIAEPRSNKLSQRQTPDAQAGKQEPAF